MQKMGTVGLIFERVYAEKANLKKTPKSGGSKKRKKIPINWTAAGRGERGASSEGRLQCCNKVRKTLGNLHYFYLVFSSHHRTWL